MKAAAFEYSRPNTLDEACALLAADDGARLIAGGQTLVPLMAMRLARPTRLVDIARLSELDFVRDNRDTFSIGATTKQCDIESDPLVAAKVPLLFAAMPYVGHIPTRARGTVGGSLANADPAAEIALVAVTLGAAIGWRDGDKVSETEVGEFIVGPMVTSLPQAACLTEARFPVWPERRVGVGFHEVNARRSDFAFVAAAAQIALDGEGRVTRIALGLGAATPFPIGLDADALAGTRCEQPKVKEVVAAAVDGIEAMEDLHASAAYRKRAAATLAMRAIADAYKDAHAR